MRLITTNEQLLALLPNIMTVVKGERPVIDKIVPFIEASEKCQSSEGRIELALIMLSRDSIALNEMAHRQHCVRDGLQFHLRPPGPVNSKIEEQRERR